MAAFEEFEKALSSFREGSSSQRLARMCAELSIEHFEAHGDVTYCQRLLDAMPQNYLRREAFRKWLRAHFPIGENEEGKLCKDVRESPGFRYRRRKGHSLLGLCPEAGGCRIRRCG